MAEQRAEVDAITADPGPATFENTIVALERSGRDPAAGVGGVLHAGQLVQHAGDPRDRGRGGAAAGRARRRDHAGPRRCSPASRRCSPPGTTWTSTRSRCACSSATTATPSGPARGSDPAEQERLRALNAELSALSTEFGTRLLAERERRPPCSSTTRRSSTGCPADAISAAARAAADRGHDGRLPAHARAARPVSRRSPRSPTAGCASGCTWRPSAAGSAASTTRATSCCGSPRCAPSGPGCSATRTTRRGRWRSARPAPSRRSTRCSASWPRWRRPTRGPRPPSCPRRPGFPIEAWDRAFYAERVRRERFDLDADALRPYFELERVLHDGVFHAAGRLYGLRFAERHDLPRYHPDVRDLRRVRRGRAARAVRRRPLRPRLQARRRLDELLRHAVAAAGHDAGGAEHAQHRQARRRRADAADGRQRAHPVPRVRPRAARAVLRRALPDVLRHRRCRATSSSSRRRSTRCGWTTRRSSRATPVTTRPASRCRRSWSTRLAAARRFGEGFATTEYLAATLLDQAWHRLGPDDRVDRRRTVRGRRARPRPASPCPARRRATARTYFNHIFGGGYSAGYYSYIWSEVLDADTVEWFAENGGLRRENGDALPPRAALPRRRRRPDGRPTAPSAAATPRSPHCSPAAA